MPKQKQNVIEVVKDEEFLYASIKGMQIKVIRRVMNMEVTVDVGAVRSYNNFYIKINDCYYIRNENKFISHI